MERLSSLLTRFELPKLSPERKEQFEAEQAAERARERRRRYELVKIPEKYRTASVEDCCAKTRQYARELHNGGKRGLVLRGAVGVGKTHTAAAILNAVFDKRQCRFSTLGAFLREIRSTMDGRDFEDAVMAKYLGVDVLVVDDFGKERPSAWALPLIFELLDGRYVRQRPTIYTTQHDGRGLARRLSNEGDVAIAEAILSRLGDREAFASIVLEGDDRRRMTR